MRKLMLLPEMLIVLFIIAITYGYAKLFPRFIDWSTDHLVLFLTLSALLILFLLMLLIKGLVAEFHEKRRMANAQNK